ncbi:hypothetical protein MAR_037685 [Mya arenaria]|uniref:Uncharacterized protein n=1 Tax=Mya arenaria TaxID=6604 RepID=A0ABY7FT06_MYAAR|nr:hypothetical protein MAR_037685 [Mya arenaria]
MNSELHTTWASTVWSAVRCLEVPHGHPQFGLLFAVLKYHMGIHNCNRSKTSDNTQYSPLRSAPFLKESFNN